MKNAATLLCLTLCLAGWNARAETYDFWSSPFAGLFPGWRTGYRAARRLDDSILKMAPLRRVGSNFEVIANRSR